MKKFIFLMIAFLTLLVSMLTVSAYPHTCMISPGLGHPLLPDTDCDGVVDISPFTCMNGIVTEVIYPYVSRDHNDIPIRIFYFDGVPFDLEGDLEIFMEQVKSYRKRKKHLTAKIERIRGCI